MSEKKTHADPEIEAIAAVKQALDPLDQETRVQVIRWAAARFNAPDGTTHSQAPVDAGDGSSTGTGEWRDFPSLHTAADPQSDPDRALISGYWFQVVGDGDDFSSQDVNKELKQVGQGVKNITRAFDALIEKRPAEAMQVRKSGKTKQARKRYQLTAPGIQRAEAMLRGGVEPQSH